ncbi:MAG: AAA family ATPase [Thermoguttaceae bacterium]|nr:AAA family ATPase [Thermoguttaceae bacterium]
MEYRENRDARRPFLSTPDSRVYFPASAIERARRATARCLRRSEGVALVVGATGVGKTLLTRVLAAEFEAESLVAVVSPTRRIDVKSFWQQFLFSLRQTFCGCDETELRLMALDYLERSSRRRCVLLIDDAQRLPFRVFDELRSFVDQGAAASSQVCVALFGTPVLEERLNLPSLYPFQQRIASRSYLDAFERSEIADYIDRETERVGGGFLFNAAAKRKIADLSEGSPRVANQLCDRALFLTGASDGKSVGFDEEIVLNGDGWRTAQGRVKEVDAPLVERAWANLLNLPEDGPKSTAGELADVVEFGTLDDDDEDYNDFNAWRGDATERWETEEDSNDAEQTGRVENSDRVDGVDCADGVFGEENEAEEERDDEEESESGEIDAELEARLLRNLTIWEATQESEGVKNVENIEIESVESVEREENVDFNDFAEAERVERGDRWERVDELKERIGTADELFSAKRAARETTLESGESNETREIVEKTATETSVDVEANESANFSQKTEERVFEALKSEYFDSGFLFELPEDGNRVDERRVESPRKPRAKTRRPLPSGSDGRLFDGSAALDGEDARDERFWEARTTSRNVARRSVSDSEAAGGWENEFASPEDLAYEQIVEDCFQTVNDFSASDEYLSELSLLEQEIAEEANLIRRIRSIHLKLRSARAAGRRRRRDAEEENNVAPTGDGEKTLDAFDELGDAAINY